MYDQVILDHMQKTWPETEDYLRRVGQVTNDLLALRELLVTERPAPTWMEKLAVDEADLLQTPSSVEVLRFLHTRGILVRSAAEVTEYQELRDEQTEAFETGEASTPEILEDLAFALPARIDARLWALPELQEKLTAWAAETSERYGRPESMLSLTQVTLLMQLARFLEQESEQSAEWAAECLRSALSSEFFEKAGNLPG